MIQSVFIENFKAIYKAASFPIQPFTVFIGNNGAGKSSILEALRALQIAANSNLNDAFSDWGGFERIINYNAALPKHSIDNKKLFNPIIIGLTAEINKNIYQYRIHINIAHDTGFYIVEHEELKCNNNNIFIVTSQNIKDGLDAVIYTSTGEAIKLPYRYSANSLLLGYKGSFPISDELEEFSRYVEDWQFLSLNAHNLGKPILQNRVLGQRMLDYDGRNIADHLLWLKNQNSGYLDNLIRKMQFILPYIKGIEPHINEETVNREVELLFYEKDKVLPGWLLSSGTLRILALLSVFERPQKPSVLFVDEIENGLDPRTIGLLLNQVEDVLLDKSMQVIFTTHSPYFLDLVSIESIVVAEKDNDGSTFHIPIDEENLKLWKERFSPGRLYTMGKLTK